MYAHVFVFSLSSIFHCTMNFLLSSRFCNLNRCVIWIPNLSTTPLGCRRIHELIEQRKIMYLYNVLASCIGKFYFYFESTNLAFFSCKNAHFTEILLICLLELNIDMMKNFENLKSWMPLFSIQNFKHLSFSCEHCQLPVCVWFFVFDQRKLISFDLNHKSNHTFLMRKFNEFEKTDVLTIWS